MASFFLRKHTLILKKNDKELNFKDRGYIGGLMIGWNRAESGYGFGLYFTI